MLWRECVRIRRVLGIIHATECDVDTQITEPLSAQFSVCFFSSRLLCCASRPTDARASEINMNYLWIKRMEGGGGRRHCRQINQTHWWRKTTALTRLWHSYGPILAKKCVKIVMRAMNFSRPNKCANYIPCNPVQSQWLHASILVLLDYHWIPIRMEVNRFPRTRTTNGAYRKMSALNYFRCFPHKIISDWILWSFPTIHSIRIKRTAVQINNFKLRDSSGKSLFHHAQKGKKPWARRD